jgi:phosphatidylglycerophosphate synthase
VTKNTFYARLLASSLLEKGGLLSVGTIVKSSVNGVNKYSRSGFEVLAKPVVKILKPHNNRWVVRNLANIISTVRLPLSLVVVIGWVYPAYVNRQMQNLYISLGVMLIILLSDGFDGSLARGLDVVSRYGKAVDPVADKVFYVAMTVSLLVGATKLVPREIVIVMAVCMVPAIYYEVRLVTIAVVTDKECRIRHSAEPVGANMWGKAKFALQAAAGFAGFGLPWATAGFSLAMCLVVLSLPMAHMSLRGHQLDLEAIRAKPII